MARRKKRTRLDGPPITSRSTISSQGEIGGDPSRAGGLVGTSKSTALSGHHAITAGPASRADNARRVKRIEFFGKPAKGQLVRRFPGDDDD